MYSAMSDAITSQGMPPSRDLISGHEGAFTAGNDITDFVQSPPAGNSPVFAFAHNLHRQKPIVAAVNGVAVGIGFTMLLHYDLVMLAMVRFQLPFVNLGLVPGRIQPDFAADDWS